MQVVQEAVVDGLCDEFLVSWSFGRHFFYVTIILNISFYSVKDERDERAGFSTQNKLTHLQNNEVVHLVTLVVT